MLSFLFINPKDRFNGENQKLVGNLNAFNRNINSFIENTVKELSSNNDKFK